MHLPERFVRVTLDMYGETGQAWLEQLPALLAEIAGEWSLSIGKHFPNLGYNYVAPALRADGVATVLKVTPFRPHDVARESAALRTYGGRGAVALLAVDQTRGAMLLERATPGTMLRSLAMADDEEGTRIAALVLRDLWQPVPATHPFRLLEERAAELSALRVRYDGGTGPLAEALVTLAEVYFAELLATTERRVVLHGDLHYENILAAERAPWLAIDPKGLVGDPAYEPSTLMYNPMPDFPSNPDAPRLLRRRLDVLTEVLGCERVRLRRWAVAQAVLSAWWNLESLGREWEPFMHIAEVLAAL